MKRKFNIGKICNGFLAVLLALLIPCIYTFDTYAATYSGIISRQYQLSLSRSNSYISAVNDFNFVMTEITQDMVDGHTYEITLKPYVDLTSVSGGLTGAIVFASAVERTWMIYSSNGIDAWIVSNSSTSVTTTFSFKYHDDMSLVLYGRVSAMADASNATSNRSGTLTYQAGVTVLDIVDVGSGLKTDNEALNSIDQNIQDQFNQEVDNANQGVSDTTGVINSAQDLETKWEILWYPITITKRFSEMLSGGTAAAYNVNGIPVSGYTYNPNTGLLEPVLSRTRSSTSGTVITFPAFTLPVLDVQLWDEFEYDISSVREQFPSLFAMSDVVFTIIEFLFVIDFLYGKYIAIFGNGGDE